MGLQCVICFVICYFYYHRYTCQQKFLEWNLILTLAQFLGENYWKNPEKFDPNRFFDTSGKLNIPEAFIPFGLGMLFDNITA